MDPRKEILSKVVSLLWLLSLLFSAVINCFPISTAYAASVPQAQFTQNVEVSPSVASHLLTNSASITTTNVENFQTNLFSGDFETTYPITVPLAGAQPVPGVTLEYDSGRVWGSDTNTNGQAEHNTNGQAGQEGLGWQLEPGSISEFTTLGLFGPDDWGLVFPYYIYTYFINLNGVRSRLVNVSDNLYRLENDPGWSVEMLTSNEPDHPDDTKVYWLVTTADGAQYRFGGEMVPANERAAGASGDQDSVAYTPIRTESFPNPKAYKWYLDRVEDVDGNIINYYYSHEINYFEAPGDTSARYEYVRATHLDRIEYTKRGEGFVQPSVRIRFNLEVRCINSAATNCSTAAFVPDAPQDYVCSNLTADPCVQTWSIFWSDRRLDSIQTQLYDQAKSTWRTASVYDLSYDFPALPGTGSPQKLWLKSIEQRPGGDYNRIAFSQIEAESYDSWSGSGALQYQAAGHNNDIGGGLYIDVPSANDYLVFRRVNFGAGSNQMLVRYLATEGSDSDDVALELRLDSPVGPKIGKVETGDPTGWKTDAFGLTDAKGVHDLYVVFKHTNVRLNWIRFLPTNPLPAGLPATVYTPVTLQGPVTTTHDLPVIGTVKTEPGGTVSVTYGQTYPCTADFTTVRPPYDCFRDEWSNQYRSWKVTRLTKTDPSNISANESYTYTYSTPAWRYFAYPILYPITGTCWDIYPNCTKRQWNDFRGHAVVTETNTLGEKTEYRYYQGMDGDQLNITGGTYSAHITLSDGRTRVDSNWLRGKLAETRQFDANGKLLVRNVYRYTDIITADSGDNAARLVLLEAHEQIVDGPVPKARRIEYDYDSNGALLGQREIFLFRAHALLPFLLQDSTALSQ